MEFKITLDEFWLDQEEDIEPALKNHIISSVVGKIRAEIDERIKDQIEKNIKIKVEEYLSDRISNELDRVIKEGKVRGPHAGDPEITLEEYIKHQFVKVSGWGSQSQKIEILAKEFATEMKDRYDILFASHLVAKMNENGLLKEDVAKLLLKK